MPLITWPQPAFLVISNLHLIHSTTLHSPAFLGFGPTVCSSCSVLHLWGKWNLNTTSKITSLRTLLQNHSLVCWHRLRVYTFSYQCHLASLLHLPQLPSFMNYFLRNEDCACHMIVTK